MFIEPSRRQFVALLAGSPLLAALGLDRAELTRFLEGQRDPHRAALDLAQRAAEQSQPALITKASEALDVMDFMPVAKEKIPVAHWGYLMTGTDDDRTIQANIDGYDRWALKPRRLVDVSTIDMATPFYGQTYSSPIVLNPLGSQKGFHPQGEVAVALADGGCEVIPAELFVPATRAGVRLTTQRNFP